MKAVNYYHMAQSPIKQDTEEKKQSYWSVARAFEKAGKYMRPPLEVVQYPFRGITFSAYFRKATGNSKPPCVITVRGVDASRQVQDHLFSEFLLERGLSTLSIDCQGQQAARFAGLNMTSEFEKPVGAAIDYLETRNDVDLDRLGIIGVSFGGFIAPRAASLEKRLKACVSVGGFYSMAEFDYGPSAKANFINDTKFSAAEYTVRKKEFTLEGIIEQMTCSLLVVNGSQDPLQPKGQSVKIYEHARCPKDMMIYEGYGHCAYNQDKGVIVSIADWLSAKLSGKRYKAKALQTDSVRPSVIGG